MSEMIGGAVISEGLRYLIAERKKFKIFKPLSKKLVSTMEKLIPLTKTIVSLQNQQNLDVEELTGLMETIDKAKIVVDKCRNVPWWKRSLVTREIEEVNEDMLNHCQTVIQLLLCRNQLQSMEANNNNFQNVNQKLDQLIVPSPVLRQLCSVPELKDVPVGFALPLMMLKKKLLDPAVARLVVSAPAGCGKTTLVTQLCHDQDIKKEFKHIFYNVVSSTPDFRVIVQRLLEHNRHHQAPTFDNDTQAANALKTLLEGFEGSDAILLVLDDVWSAGARLFLENFPTDIPNLKILATSRFDLLDFGDTFKLEPLKKEHAETLLTQYASRPDHASNAEYERLLQKILERCTGLPLLIKVIGSSLKKKSLTQWQGQVIIWSKEGGTVLDIPGREVIDRLQPSFDALHSDDLKLCFLDMGLFLEDQKIRAWMIIDIWAELYGDGHGRTEKEKIIQSMTSLEDLASHNLLDLLPLGKKEHEDGFHNDFLVTQHDMLRELAINQNKSEAILERKRLTLDIKGDRFPDWCLNPIHPVVNACVLSIFTDNSFSSTWFEMDCPNVEALLLNISSSNYELPSFIATMKKLKVVIIINHGPGPATLTNLSCLSLLPNLKRIRLEKVSITFLDILQLQLVSLKKLSLFMCRFGEVSYDKKEIDVSKALPSLQEIDIDYCYDLKQLPYWISEAVSLEKLSITHCHKLPILPETIGSLSKLEVLRLSSCVSLSELPETIARLGNLQFLDISHCLGLKKLPIEIGRLQKLTKIYMSKCGNCKLPYSVRNLENLEVKCDEETATLWKGLKLKMSNLTVQEEETEPNLNLLRLFNL